MILCWYWTGTSNICSFSRSSQGWVELSSAERIPLELPPFLNSAAVASGRIPSRVCLLNLRMSSWKFRNSLQVFPNFSGFRKTTKENVRENFEKVRFPRLAAAAVPFFFSSSEFLPSPQIPVLPVPSRVEISVSLPSDLLAKPVGFQKVPFFFRAPAWHQLNAIPRWRCNVILKRAFFRIREGRSRHIQESPCIWSVSMIQK